MKIYFPGHMCSCLTRSEGHFAFWSFKHLAAWKERRKEGVNDSDSCLLQQQLCCQDCFNIC